jgi:hypothetical protein
MQTTAQTAKIAANFIDEEQFKLKLGFTYCLCTGFSFIAIIVIFFVFNLNASKSAALYGITMLLYYKFWFNYTKKGQHYQPFFLNKLAALYETVRMKAAEF